MLLPPYPTSPGAWGALCESPQAAVPLGLQRDECILAAELFPLYSGGGGIQTHPQTRLSPPAELWGQKWAESTVSSAEGLKLSRPTASSLSPQMVPPYTQVEKPKPRERTRPVSQEQLAVAPLTYPARAALA